MVSWLDEWAYRNRLAKLRATFKLTFSFILLIWAMIGTNVGRLLTIGWMLTWLIVYARLPWRACLRVCLLFSLVILWSSAPLLLSFDGDVVDVSYVGTICLRAFTCSLVLFFLAATTPFFRLACALQTLRIPRVLIELLLLTYRFIFMLEKAARELFVTVRVRQGERNWQIASLAVAQLLRHTLHQYEEMVIAQRARHVSFTVPRCTDEQLPKRYVIEASLGIVVLLIVEGLYVAVS